MTLRAEKMAERRERILRSAREIIAEDGFEALTTRALAQRARVTVPTIYNLVGAKDAVLFAAVEDQTERFLHALGSREDRPPTERVVGVCHDCVDELLRAPRYYRALLQLMQASESAGEARRSVGRTVVREFESGVEALRASGHVVGWLETQAVAERLGAHLTAVAMQWATGELGDTDFRRTAVLGTCLMLLGVTSGDARAWLERQARTAQEHGGRASRAAASRASTT